MKTVQLFFAHILCFCIACSTNTADEQLIVAKRMAFNEAISGHDASSISKYCAEDITVITSRNSKATSREQYAGLLEQEFKTKDDVVYVRTPESIQIFAPWGMAAESGHWIGHWKTATELIEVEGTYYAKWKKVNGEWLINAEVFTAMRCTGGAYCSEVPK